MHTHAADLSTCSALVVDGNPTMRAIMRALLRDIGMGTIVQTGRPTDARRTLENRRFDFVLCELQFHDESYSGQDLLDDLRRNQLLPFTTVFIIVTAEATYRRVAEAAESALDSFMLKPYSPAQLAKRLFQSRARKNALKDIFSAMADSQFDLAAERCLKRFDGREKYWLYAARLGAEILLRLGRPDEAQTMFRAIIDARALPWAKLGVARAQLEAGQGTHALTTLETLITEEPQFADAYDVMGRAHFELGKFSQALETYAMAVKLTPHSIGRLQSLAMMTYYAGDSDEAESLLERTVRQGQDSKLFDPQVLVLLAFLRVAHNDNSGLLRCKEELRRLLEKDPEQPRLLRMAAIIDAIGLVAQNQFNACISAVRALGKTINDNLFDFETAGNFLNVLALFHERTIQLEENEALVNTIGLRFCSNRPLTELLCASVRRHPPYADQLRACQTTVMQYAQAGLSSSMSGDPATAVQELLRRGKETLNARLLENAHQLLQKNADKIGNAAELGEELQVLRKHYGMGGNRPSLGDPKGRMGGLSLDHYANAKRTN